MSITVHIFWYCNYMPLRHETYVSSNKQFVFDFHSFCSIKDMYIFSKVLSQNKSCPLKNYIYLQEFPTIDFNDISILLVYQVF